jgi:E3 ubiquitin-protein ligase UBR1
VFCLRCFHGTNHEGHDTSFSVNNGGGGCCDCGDPEAWKVELDCIYHSAKHIPQGETDPKNLEYPPEVTTSIRRTIAAVLDFIIDTMTTSPENMNGTRVSKEQIQRDAVDAGNIAGETTNLDLMDFVCILWNDEDHSFTDVINRVSETTNMASNYARKIAETVDTQVSWQVYDLIMEPIWQWAFC